MNAFRNRSASYLFVTLVITALPMACSGNSNDKASLPEKRSDAAPPATPAATPPQVAPTQAAMAATGQATDEPQVAAPDLNSSAPITSETAPATSSTPSTTVDTVSTRLTGQVTAQRTSKIGFEVGGFIAEAVAKPGTVLKKGDVLATLQAEDFELRLQLARARRDQAKVQADIAFKDYEREVQLKKENASTSAVFEKVQAAHEQARLALKLAELDLTQAERNFADTKLRAPYDCVVATQLKFDGENVQAGNAVFEVVDLSMPEITFEAPERLFGKVELGDKVNVLIPSAGFKGQAEVVRMVPVIAERTRTFKVITRPLEGSERVVPGSFAEATIN